ncbi:DUF4181 domain-containing protein [Bacillus carboniphilus]|uniref:DUF4181 domain-containing protein n=1 Tax=Bacillus carboniphilus TaxID=86663 RepID=A0ABY9JWA8_9BACI|nr:DUF4181 domain-containing protein [Bacillus carboniphilus]WLR43676.1 DUF4181 domain-containing protein [Bacillus carboniphilus]
METIIYSLGIVLIIGIIFEIYRRKLKKKYNITKKKKKLIDLDQYRGSIFKYADLSILIVSFITYIIVAMLNVDHIIIPIFCFFFLRSVLHGFEEWVYHKDEKAYYLMWLDAFSYTLMLPLFYILMTIF